MNFKKILLGSAIAAASFGFFACGDEGSSDSVVGPDGKEPAGPKIDIPKQSALSPITVNGLKVTVMSGTNGMRGSLGGVIKIDPEFMDTSEPYTANVDIKIDSVSFAVGRVIDGKPYQEKININLDGQVFPTDMVSFSQKYIEFSELSACGEFQLYIFAYSSSKEEGIKTSLYTTVIDTLKFTRPEAECKAPEPIESSSSAAAVCTPVTANELVLSNTSGGALTAINFETGAADNPHVTLKFTGGDAFLVPGAGTTIYEDNNQISGLLPTKSPICKEDFSRSSMPLDADEELVSGLWLDVVTADGKMFPLMIQKVMKEANTKGTVNIVYYK